MTLPSRWDLLTRRGPRVGIIADELVYPLHLLVHDLLYASGCDGLHLRTEGIAETAAERTACVERLEDQTLRRLCDIPPPTTGRWLCRSSTVHVRETTRLAIKHCWQTWIRSISLLITKQGALIDRSVQVPMLQFARLATGKAINDLTKKRTLLLALNVVMHLARVGRAVSRALDGTRVNLALSPPTSEGFKVGLET